MLTNGFVVAAAVHGQQYIQAVGEFFSISGSVYGDYSTANDVYIQGFNSDNTPANVKFTCETLPIDALLLFSPCNGTTPQYVRVSVNPSVVRNDIPGLYHQEALLSTVDQSPPKGTFFFVDVTVTAPAPPAIGAVVSAASLQQPSISPGEIVSIFGSSLGSPILSAQPDANSLYPTLFGQTTVTFNGVPAPTLFNNTTQINAVVPYAIAGQKTAQVVVSHYGQVSVALSVPLADTSPGIFTLTEDGHGQGAILNVGATVTVNGPTNPAPRGLAIGLVLVDVPQPAIVPKASVSLTIGGQPAQILYAGAAPYMVSGVLQVNAIVPDGAGSGSQVAVVTVGQADNSKQSATVTIK
jgi:uncharacterized protein (TIGR03437 family)